MKTKWITVEDYNPERPVEVDTVSSPTTVYLNKNITRESKTDLMTGETISFWKCERAALTRSEYEQYEQMQQVFGMPEFEALRSQMQAQQLTMDEIVVNTEYSVCLQELSM